MDAIFSGQAGALALIEGADVRLLRSLDERVVRIDWSNVGHIFRWSTDTVVQRGTREEIARTQFAAAWRNDRALRLSLLAIDPEEEFDIRVEAANLIESFYEDETVLVHVSNQFYSRPLPQESDLSCFLGDLKLIQWPNATKFFSRLVSHQPMIQRQRSAWDKLPASLFLDLSKPIFEEAAINLGAFRILGSVSPDSDPNLAIFDCYNLLRSLPNARDVITQWTAEFRRHGTKLVAVSDEEADEADETTSERSIHRASIFQNVVQQQDAIARLLRSDKQNLARRFTDQLVQYQLKSGGSEFAAKSLCNLAQEAKFYGLHSLQLEWALQAVGVNPEDSWAHGQAADALMSFYRLDEALHQLQLAEAFGDPQFAANGRARILRLQGRFDEALKEFRNLQVRFEGHSGEPFAWAGSAETLREMWRLDEALAEYDDAIRRFPTLEFLQCGRASVLTDLGTLDEALAAYDRILSISADLVALNGKATVLKQMGRLDEALEVTAEAISLFPASHVARCSQGDILRLKGNLIEALQVYDNVKRRHPWQPVAFSGHAEVLRDMQRLPEAIAAYEDAVQRFPLEEQLANGLANAHKVNDDLPEALRLYELSVRRFPYSLVSKVGRADLLKRLGKYSDAIAAYDDILKTWPAFPMAKHAKAAVLVVMGKFSEAERLLPSEYPRTHDEWVGWHVRGMILLRTGKLADAIGHFRDGGMKTPFVRERRYFQSALCLAQMQIGEFDKAADAIDEPRSALPKILHFHALAGTGKHEQAIAVYRDLSKNCPARLVHLRDAIAARFRIVADRTPHNDNWIFGKEAEALLQEAA
jgi:tetratricopeptide (TPR) repeat protein